MSDHRHRGFSGLCCFSDVNGNITRYYVPFAVLPAPVKPSRRSARPPAVRVRRLSVHAPHSEHTFFQSGISPPPMRRNSPAVLPSAAVPAHAPHSPPQTRFSQQTRLRVCVHALNRPKHPLSKLVNSECCTNFSGLFLSHSNNPTDCPKKSHFLRARKNAHDRHAANRRRRKKCRCILVSPEGRRAKPLGRQEHGTRRRRNGGMPIQAATADVAPAHMVKCAG